MSMVYTYTLDASSNAVRFVRSCECSLREGNPLVANAFAAVAAEKTGSQFQENDFKFLITRSGGERATWRNTSCPN
jgi:hypothetical protein